MSESAKASIYRDRLGAGLVAHEARRRHAADRAARLGAAARRELPRAHRRALLKLEADLAASPTTLDELEAAESALERYEGLLDDAITLLPDFREQRALGRRWRWQRGLVAGLVIAAVATLAAVQGRAELENHRCRSERDCRVHGLCTALPHEHGPYTCAAVLSSDCEGSEACAIEGACVPAYVGKVCGVYSDGWCRQSEVCKTEGRCEAYLGKECIATDDSLCRALPACRSEGACTAREMRCQPTFPEDCAGSAACAEHGACVIKDHRCVVPAHRDPAPVTSGSPGRRPR